MAQQHGWSQSRLVQAMYTALGPILVLIFSLVLSSGPEPRAASGPCDAPVLNPIVCENSKPGNPSSEWDISGAGDPDIQGFATDISVNQGDTVQFKIDTNSDDYRLDIYRMGYYVGMGARKISTVQPSASLPQNQPACLTDSSTGLIDCGNWAVSASWTVPADATSGIYFAKLVREDQTSEGSHIMFVVRDDNGGSDLLFQTSDTTWQAYNSYGGNSLYTGGPGTNPGRAYEVSYNRPFNTRTVAPEDWVFNAEYPMVRWLEANGYYVSYFTGVDTDRRGSEILEHTVFLSVGHDEYWSATQRANVEAARAAGVHLAFFSGNEVFWKVRWDTSIDGSGTPYRSMVSYKETHANAKIDPSSSVWTGTWRDPRFSQPADGGRPENALTGTIFMVNSGTSAIEVPAADGKMRFWRNTTVATLAPGQIATLSNSTLGYEWDEELDNGFRPAGLVRLSSTTVDGVQRLLDHGSTYGTGTATHNLTLYRHSSGALVFGAGTIQWPWGLDGNHDRGSSTPDLRMRQATVNLFADMEVQPDTLQAGLVAATTSPDTIAPNSTISSPTDGGSVQIDTQVTITGTAMDSDGGAVGSVEVSLDEGTTWHPATGRESWTYAWVPKTLGSVTIKSRAVDDSGNLEGSPASITVTVTSGPPPPTCPCSLWNAATTPSVPAENDSAAVEVGVKFRSDVNGYITGLRFYKGTGNTGTHVGHLWTSGGALLASATFTNETASGWQQVTLTSPTPITANTTYVASYHTPTGRYSVDGSYFNVAFANPPLRALADGVEGGNGVYKYGASGFPTETYQATNYWIDVVFNTTLPPDNSPPTISDESIPPGATNVSVGTNIDITFSEALDPTTVNTTTFELRGPSNVIVPSAVTYDPATATVTINPNATLQPLTSYTVTVKGGASGVKDLAGNSLNGNMSWSFTTGTTQTCPCTLWSSSTTPTIAAENDSQAIEVGVRFRSESDGYITGLRFYKGPGNTGTHVGHLWTNSGTLLRTVTFSTETASGWQQVNLPSPQAISANTTYVASYQTLVGRYALDEFYFASSDFANSPLRALEDGEDGLNGVFKYGGGFPTDSFASSNYWVDVVFNTVLPPDTTPPTLSVVSPANGDLGVNVNTTVTATFTEPMNGGTITGGTFELRDSNNDLVAASVSYNTTSFTATLLPNSPLARLKTYTATVKGGGSGVKDQAGNPLTANFTWSFTTLGASPNDGPGGPILIVSAPSQPFSRYYAEILRAEGLNAFAVSDLSSVSASTLAAYDVVILGEMSLTTTQVTMFSDWVTAGGNLIAMRPDKKLTALLGLTDASATLTNAYLLVNTSPGPGAGIVNQTIQFRGTADRYTLNGASSLATLYSGATSTTSNPAVTLRSVGTSGGQAAAFTYDLARSIIGLRQGNVAWAGQERDGIPPLRSDDMYFGAASGNNQPDWVDLNKAIIPQADEQQRLLANLVIHMNRDQKPLPRFSYFPQAHKAIVIMTGDDHGNGGTIGRFDQYKNSSSPDCVVADWKCIRGTSYIYPTTPLSDTQAAEYAAEGFEVALHVSTGCDNWTTRSSLESFYSDQLDTFAAAYPSIPSPTTNRTHCIVWSDYATQAEVELDHGIRLDTTYYYWPASWVADRPGFFTGSGMPMRFAAASGAMIDVYQAATQMTDESGQSFPMTVNTLLDNALGSTGYYGAFTANMHTDSAESAGSDAIIASAIARGVPVVSARQMLIWLDGRNGSSFGALSWDTNTLSFSIAVGTGARGLHAMVPTISGIGPLTQITRNGSPISYTLQIIKGIQYALFPAVGGTYEATYTTDTTPPDTTPPTVSSVSPSAGSTNVNIATAVTGTFSEPMEAGTINGSTFELRDGSAVLVAGSVSYDAASHKATFQPSNPLATSTTYTATIKSGSAGVKDVAGNPLATNFSWSFSTAAAPLSNLTDTTIGDFNAGSVDANTYIAEDVDGEVILSPTSGIEFSGTTLPSIWTSAAWNAGGAATVANGALTVDGALAGTADMYGPGRALEFVATFSGAAFQHVGFGVTFNEALWAIFSTREGGSLYARTNSGGASAETPLPGSWLGTPHRYRIDWNAASIVYSIDGNVVATHSIAISQNMRPVVSDYNTGGGAIAVDWLHLSPYAASGTFISRVLDAGAVATWGTASWTSNTPGGTNIIISVRTGNTSTPDASWTPFGAPLNSGATIGASSRYLQYRAVLSTSNPAQTPVFHNISIEYGQGGS